MEVLYICIYLIFKKNYNNRLYILKLETIKDHTIIILLVVNLCRTIINLNFNNLIGHSVKIKVN